MNSKIFFPAVLSLASCFSKNSDVKVSVAVKTPEGEPITDAQIYVDKSHVGDTNAFGTKTWNFEAEQNSRHRIEVKKNGETYYFAPYFETVLIPKKKDFVWTVAATMYMVPKPKAKTTTFREEEITKAEEVRAEIKESVFDKSPFVLPPHEGLDTKTINAEATVVSSPKDDFVTPDSAVLTVHTYAERVPLENASVFSCAEGKLTPLCTSNARGRCVARFENKNELSQASLFVKANGYTTLEIMGPFDANANIRTSLRAGSEVSFIATFNNYGDLSPAPGLAFSVDGVKGVVQSQACGVTRFPALHGKPKTYKARLASDSVSPRSRNIVIEDFGSVFSTVELIPAISKVPLVLTRTIVPGVGFTQADASRLLTTANRTRISNQLRSGFEAKRILEASTTGEATHSVQPYFIRMGEALQLAAVLKNKKGEVIATVKTPIDISTEDSQNKASDILAEKISAALSRNDPAKLNSKEPFETSDRWIAIETEPKYTGLAWASGTMHYQLQDVPVNIGAFKDLVVEAPPGYLNAQVQIEDPNTWIEANGSKSIKLEKDILAVASDLTRQNNVSEALKILGETPKNHPQRVAATALTAILQSQSGTVDKDILVEISSVDTSETTPIEILGNKITAFTQLSQLDSETNEARLKAGEQALALIESTLPVLKAKKREDMLTFLLIEKGIAKNVVSSLKDDPVMAADSEADLKEYLKLTEDRAEEPRTRYLRVVATKNLRSVERQ